MPNTAATESPGTMSKGEFAELCNVAKSRVSHWIKDGRISGGALSGSGRAARIVVEIAQAQLRARLEPYQMMATGNGGKTRLEAGALPIAEAAASLSDDANQLMAILSEMPANAAWEMANTGETTQRAFDLFTNLRMTAVSEMRRAGFIVTAEDFEAVDWAGLAEEVGLTLIDPATMATDWQRRRDEP